MDDTSRRHRMAAPVTALAAVLAAASLAGAQTGPDLLLAPFDEGQNANLSADAYLLGRVETDNDDGHGVSLGVYNASGRVKLDLDQFARSWNLNRAQPRGGFDFTHLDIHTDDPALPDQFDDFSIGFGMGIASEGKWRAGISLGIGYASATTFGDANALYGKADLVFGYDINENETLGIVLDYNGNRTFLPDVPLPGFVYRRKFDNQRFVLEVGFPFSDITWTPDDHWSFMFRYNFPDGGEANIDYRIVDGQHIYASLQQQTDAFHWNQLDNSSDRVIFNQTRAEIGWRGTFAEKYNVIVAGGYAFDQSFEVGWDSRDSDDLAELDAAPYVRVGVEFKF